MHPPSPHPVAGPSRTAGPGDVPGGVAEYAALGLILTGNRSAAARLARAAARLGDPDDARRCVVANASRARWRPGGRAGSGTGPDGGGGARRKPVAIGPTDPTGVRPATVTGRPHPLLAGVAPSASLRWRGASPARGVVPSDPVLWAAVRALPAPAAHLVALVAAAGLTAPEAGAVLGMAPGPATSMAQAALDDVAGRLAVPVPDLERALSAAAARARVVPAAVPSRRRLVVAVVVAAAAVGSAAAVVTGDRRAGAVAWTPSPAVFTTPATGGTCTSRQLRAGPLVDQGTLGTLLTGVTLLNSSRRPCELAGLPDATLHSAGTVIQAITAAVLSTGPQTVAAGGAAAIQLEVSERSCPPAPGPDVRPVLVLALPGGSLSWRLQLQPARPCLVSVTPFEVNDVLPARPDPTALAALAASLRLPAHPPAAGTLDYRVTLTNRSARPVVLVPCPDYEEVVGSAAVTADVTLRLNCAGRGRVPAHGSVTFAMRAPLTVVAGVTGEVDGDVFWQLEAVNRGGELARAAHPVAFTVPAGV